MSNFNVTRLSTSVNLRVSTQISNVFAYLSKRRRNAFIRLLIVKYLTGQKMQIKDSYLYKVSKFLTYESCLRILDDTYYDNALKDKVIILSVNQSTKDLLIKLAEEDCTTITKIVEDIYFDFLRELIITLFRKSPEKDKSKIFTKDPKKVLYTKPDNELIIENGAYYEQYKFKLD